MLNVKDEKLNFLDSLFTQKDFYFLNSLDDEISLIQNQIKKQENKRDIIVEAINSFENDIKNSNQNNISLVSNLLEDVEKSFVLVNTNIKSLYELKEILSDINTRIINLLVLIESHPSSPNLYAEHVDKLKETIMYYSNNCTDIKNTIVNNDLLINEFLSSSKFKSIFNTKEVENINAENISAPKINEKETSNKSFYSHSDIDADETVYNSNLLRISEKENRVYLPYSNDEIKSYLTQFPNDYKSPKDVIVKEFISPLNYYLKHPVLARFRETYSLIRDREGKSIIEAIKYSMNLMFTYELNPAIIAACKTQEQLENYLNCLEKKQLEDFKDFEIKFEINPL